MKLDLNAEQLRVIAYTERMKDVAVSNLVVKIHDTASKGKLYLKTGLEIKYLKEYKKYCKEMNLRFNDLGNDGSGSDFTTVIIDWSVTGDGISFE